MVKTRRESRIPQFFFPALLSCFSLILFFAASAAAQPLSSNEPLKAPERSAASFADVAKMVEPAVVSIDTKGKVPDNVAKNDATQGDSDDIMEFFRRQLPRRPSYSVGSGFIVDSRGYILTNAHVVDDAARITVKLDSGEEYSATVVGSDEETDVAVLKIDAGKALPYVKLGDSNKPQVGDWVLAIGSPFGLSRTVTAGIISQMHRETPSSTAFQKFIQTDAAINRGNSGGPLVNMAGEVIGMNSQIATSTGDYNGVGFALPANEALFVYDQIVKSGKVRRGYLGVMLDSVKAEFAKVYGLKEAKGAIITDLPNPKSSAGQAGLQVGDIIVEFNGKPVENAQDLIAKVASTPPDQSISLNYLRENGDSVERKATSIMLGERPSTNRRADETPTPTKVQLEKVNDEFKPFGLTVVELTPQLATTYKLQGEKGLLVKEINPNSFIADVKASNGGEALGEGDLIQRLNRVAVTNAKSFGEAVSKLKKGDAVVMHVMSYSPRSRSTQMKIVQFTVQ